MKIRSDFVTNSSSSSFVICFARVENEEKAGPILEKYRTKTWSAEDIAKLAASTDCITFGKAAVSGLGAIINEYPNCKYILEGAESNGRVFWVSPLSKFLSELTKENGFADVQGEQAMGGFREFEHCNVGFNEIRHYFQE